MNVDVPKISKGEITLNDVQDKIITVRNRNVLLDSDVAWLYGVGTKEVNQAVKNNPGKFPEGYIFTVQSSEKQELVKNFDRFNKLKHSTVSPAAFIEKGIRKIIVQTMNVSRAVESRKVLQ